MSRSIDEGVGQSRAEREFRSIDRRQVSGPFLSFVTNPAIWRPPWRKVALARRMGACAALAFGTLLALLAYEQRIQAPSPSLLARHRARGSNSAHLEHHIRSLALQRAADRQPCRRCHPVGSHRASTLGKNPEREKVIDFTAAYSPFFQAVFAPKSLVIKTPADLAGQSVGGFAAGRRPAARAR
jgi:ABC-type amino acid transport substrate-binding protein